MSRYHFNEKTGKAGICNAQPGNCPIGKDTPHYSNKEEAVQGAENILSNTYDVLSSDKLKKETNEEPKTVFIDNLVDDFIDSPSNNFDLNHDSITQLAHESLSTNHKNKIEKYNIKNAYKVVNMSYVFNRLAERANSDSDTKNINYKLEHSAFNSDIINTEKSIRAMSTGIINMMIDVEETHNKRKNSDKNDKEYKINQLLIKNMTRSLEKEIISYRDLYKDRKELSELMSLNEKPSNNSKHLDTNIVYAHSMMMRSGMRSSQLEAMSNYSQFLKS